MTEFFPNCWDVDYGNWEVEELRQEGQSVLPQMEELEHGEPISPQGGGRARLPNGRCDASHVERPKWGVQRVVAVDFPH